MRGDAAFCNRAVHACNLCGLSWRLLRQGHYFHKLDRPVLEHDCHVGSPLISYIGEDRGQRSVQMNALHLEQRCYQSCYASTR